MAIEAYPIDLPLMIQRGKSRQLPTSFRGNDPLNGPPFFEAFSEDRPAVFNSTFVFNSWQSRKFWAWFSNQLKHGAEWFNMNINTESGIQEMECHFVSEPQLTSQQNSVFTYSISIVARRLVNSLVEDNSEYYINADEDQIVLSGIIDEAVNIFAPEA